MTTARGIVGFYDTKTGGGQGAGANNGASVLDLPGDMVVGEQTDGASEGNGGYRKGGK